MAKFKVGQKVLALGKPMTIKKVYDGVGAIPMLKRDYGMKWTDRVERMFRSDGVWYGDGSGAFYTDDDLEAANSAPRSTNPVVQNALASRNAGVPFMRHDIYANLNTAQNRIVNAINLASHLEEPFKSKMAKGIAKIRNANDAITSAIAELAAAYKAAEAEIGDS